MIGFLGTTVVQLHRHQRSLNKILELQTKVWPGHFPGKEIAFDVSEQLFHFVVNGIQFLCLKGKKNFPVKTFFD